MYASPRRSHQIIQAPSLVQTLLSSQLPLPHTAEAKPLSHILSDTDTVCARGEGGARGRAIMVLEKKTLGVRFGAHPHCGVQLMLQLQRLPQTGFQKYPLLRALWSFLCTPISEDLRQSLALSQNTLGLLEPGVGGVVAPKTFSLFIFKFLQILKPSWAFICPSLPSAPHVSLLDVVSSLQRGPGQQRCC
jgi:hypothetical protein